MIEIWRGDKPIAAVTSWDAVWAVERLMGGVLIEVDGRPTNLVWTGLTIMPVPRKNFLLADLTA